MKKRILITGASGFVGSNMTRYFVENGYDVHILTRETSNLWRIKDIYGKLSDWKVDLKDKIKLREVIKKINPEYIIHNAMYGGKPLENDIDKIIEANLKGTINLVEALRDIDYKVFINTGSSSEYGEKTEKMKETDICNPTTIYGITKLAGTIFCQNEARKYNKNIGTIRLFSIFGNYEDKGKFFPDVILNLLDNKNVELSNPKNVRDFIHIDEVVQMYAKIISEEIKIQGEIFNCGYGKERTLGEVVEKVRAYLKVEGKIIFGAKDSREFEVKKWESDISKAKKVLNWKPLMSFETSVEKICEWFKKNKEKYKR